MGCLKTNVQVKQEVAEVICIKEEEEEVMATLLLDCKLEQNHRAETEVRQHDGDIPESLYRYKPLHL